MSRLRRILLPVMLAVAAATAGAADMRLQPLPPPAPVNAALAEFGRHLFFETRLSGDGSRSCASCHLPEKGFADGQPLSRGYNGTEHFRNAPGLLSARLKPRLMWDGRGSDLAGVVPAHAVAHREEVELRVDEDAVLVELAPASHVSLAVRLEHRPSSRVPFPCVRPRPAKAP